MSVRTRDGEIDLSLQGSATPFYTNAIVKAVWQMKKVARKFPTTLLKVLAPYSGYSSQPFLRAYGGDEKKAVEVHSSDLRQKWLRR